MKFPKFIWAVSLILISQIACTPDSSTNTDQLSGRWEIFEATRNGRPTESLAQLFFEFSADGKMKTNITGAPTEASYQLSKNQILQRESDIEIDYVVEQMSDSVLILSTELRGYSFRFVLNKMGGGQ